MLLCYMYEKIILFSYQNQTIGRSICWYSESISKNENSLNHNGWPEATAQMWITKLTQNVSQFFALKLYVNHFNKFISSPNNLQKKKRAQTKSYKHFKANLNANPYQKSGF